MHTASGRSRWPWIITAAIAVLIVIGGVIAFTVGARNGTPTADPTVSASPTTTPTPTDDPTISGGDETDEVAPTGCLGGIGRDTAMVLAAQEAAPHTMFGAVELATAYTRWVFQRPYPTDADAAIVSESLIAAAAHDEMDISSATYAQIGDITGGNVPAEAPFYLSSIGGLWLVSPDSTADRMTVSVNGYYVIDGALSPTKTSAVTWQLVWEEGAWRIAGAERPNVAAIAAGGTRYAGGC